MVVSNGSARATFLWTWGELDHGFLGCAIRQYLISSSVPYQHLRATCHLASVLFVPVALLLSNNSVVSFLSQGGYLGRESSCNIKICSINAGPQNSRPSASLTVGCHLLVTEGSQFCRLNYAWSSFNCISLWLGFGFSRTREISRGRKGV